MASISYKHCDDSLELGKLLCTLAAAEMTLNNTFDVLKFDLEKSTAAYVDTMSELFGHCDCAYCVENKKSDAKFNILVTDDGERVTSSDISPETKTPGAGALTMVSWPCVCPGFRRFFARYMITNAESNLFVVDVIQFLSSYDDDVPVVSLLGHAVQKMLFRTKEVRECMKQMKTTEETHARELATARTSIADAMKAKDLAEASLNIALCRLKPMKKTVSDLTKRNAALKIGTLVVSAASRQRGRVAADLAYRLRHAEQAVVDTKEINKAVSASCALEMEEMEKRINKMRATVVQWQTHFHKRLNERVNMAQLAERGRIAEEMAVLREKISALEAENRAIRACSSGGCAMMAVR